MIYLYLFLVLSTIALLVFSRSKKSRQTSLRPDDYEYPKNVDRKDFISPEKPFIVIAFTSRVCDSCKNVWEKAQPLKSDFVEVTEVEYEDEEGKKLHSRYGIEAVPTLIVCDENGNTVKSFVGAVTATDLWAGVAGVRGAEISQCANH